MISTFVLAAVVAFTLAVISLIAIAVMFFGLHIRDVRAFLTGKSSARAVAEYRSHRKVRKRATVLEGEQQGWEGSISHISRGSKRSVVRKKTVTDSDVASSEASTGSLDDLIQNGEPSEADTGSLFEANTDDLLEANTDELQEASTDDLVADVGPEDMTVGLIDENAERGTTMLKEDDE